VLGLLVTMTAGPAAAAPPPSAITGSTITAPSDGAELFYDGDNGSGNVTVRGTVVGAEQGTLADLRCYSAADSSSTRLVGGINVSAGAFAVSVSLSSIAGQACRLRLVPQGQNPTGAAAAPFAGPAVSISDQFSHSANGNLYGYYVLSGTLGWSFAFQSLGECAVSASYATSTPSLGSFQLFAGNACLPERSGIAPDLDSRSALQVDGLNAYPPAAISPPPNQSSPNLTGVPGFEPLAYSATFDANHDTVAITESETPTICNPQEAFPPSPASCPQLRDSGIRFTQTTTLLPGGQVARVLDQATNVDTRPHTVDALFSQSVIAPSAGELPGFEFPGQATFAAHAEPESFNEFGFGPGSIIAIGDTAAPPSSSNPVGAITYGRAPVSADFISIAGSQTATFTMHYVDTIPPGGSVKYTWSFSQATSGPQLASLEEAERDRYFAPVISINRPRNHTVTHYGLITVRGRVGDAVGIGSVTVNGKPTPLQNGGTYTALVRLRPGRQRIVAVVTNLAGVSRHASVQVTYKAKPCVVPVLRGSKLGAGRRALRNADCMPGRVIRIRSRTVRAGRIVRTSPGPGSRHRPLAKVRLYVSRGAGRARRHGELMPAAATSASPAGSGARG
jgi:hypothetical protein